MALHPDAKLFAARLTAAGVSTTLRRYDGMIHGFVHYAGVMRASVQSVDQIAAELRKSLV